MKKVIRNDVSKKSKQKKNARNTRNHKQNITDDNSYDSCGFGLIYKIKIFMKRSDASQWVIAGLTIFIVLFGMMGAYFTDKQIRIYRETTKLDLRAYVNVFIDSFSMNKGDTIKVNLKYVNNGKTPARFFFPCVGLFFENQIDSVAAKFPSIVERRKNTGFVLSNTAPYIKKIISSDVFTEDLYFSVTYGHTAIYALGLAGYTDIFNIRHHTWFCLKLNMDKSYSAYHKYNDAD